MVACKLGPILIKAMNYKLEIGKEKRQKREKIIKRLRTKTMAAKR